MRKCALTIFLALSLMGRALASSNSGDATSEPQSILAGRDGILWRTTFVLGNHLVEELPSGCARVFKLGRNPSFYSDVAINGAHSVAVVDALGRRIYVESDGALQHYDIPRSYGIPFDLVGAADDSFWVGDGSTLLKMQSGRIVETHELDGEIASMGISPDYQTLALGSEHKIGRLGANGKMIWSPPFNDALGVRMAVSNSGAVWATSQSGKMLLYDEPTTRTQRAFPLPHTDTWPAMVLFPDGTLLAAGTTWIETYRPEGLVWSSPVPNIEFMGLGYDSTKERAVFVATGDRLGYISLAQRTPVILETTLSPFMSPCPGNDPAPFW